MPSALFKINGNTAGLAANVNASSTVTLTLNDLTGVRSVTWEIIGTHSSNVAKPTITSSGTLLGQTATFSTIGGDSQAYGIKCTVNGGRDSNNTINPDLISTSAAYVLTPSGIRVGFVGESTEDSATHGVVDKINYSIINSSRIAAIGAADTILYSDGGNSQWVKISDAYIASDAAIDVSKLAAGNDGYVITTVGSNVVWAEAAGGVSAHNELTGLTNDDHTQYLLASGSRALSGDINCGYNNIRQLGTPSVATDAATKGYVDGYSWSNVSIASNAAIDVSKLAASSNDGYVLTTSSGVPTWQNAGVATGNADTVFISNGVSNSWSSDIIVDSISAKNTSNASVNLIKINASDQTEIGSGANVINCISTGLQFPLTASTPTLNQSDAVDGYVTGSALTIRAQNCSGYQTTGADLCLSSGSGTTANGSTKLQVAGSDRLAIANTLATFSFASSTKTMGLAGTSLTGRTSSIGSTVLATAPGAGLYQLNAYMECTTGHVGDGYMTLTITYSDNVGSTSQAVISAFSLKATGRAQGSIVLYLASGNITYSTARDNGSGGTYTLYMSLERIR